jgi:hypothetical protein
MGATLAAPSFAQERLCDTSYEDCRTPILNMIRAETVGIDVSFWFMIDARYSTEIIRRWQAGVPVRILLDVRADENYPHTATIRQSFINAGIPIRHKVTPGINHWKMILYAGQSRVHFSAANFADGSYSPITPYTSYVDEAIYFTDDAAVVHSFMTKFDDLWTNTSHFADLANLSARVRHYPTFPIDPALNFPPDQDYQDRLVSALRQETQQIDAMMFRITSGKVPDELIRRRLAGVPVRVITDRRQYRNPTYFWHAYNIDRMYAAGIPIKWREGTDQDMHEKAVILYGRHMAVFGSSNWTASSSDSQREHNYFTTKAWFVDWLAAQFARKWNNLRVDGTTISPALFNNYAPGWPETPVNLSPANGAANVGTSVLLRWEGGWWAHRYDVHFGTTNPPPLVARDFMPGAATAGVKSLRESFNPCSPPAPFASACPSGLAPGTTYYWMVRGKTMLGDTRRITGLVWSFTTTGGPADPGAPIGVIDTPAEMSSVAGEVGFTGWAVDNSGIVGVDIYRSPVPGEGAGPNGLLYLGTATQVEGARPDVASAFPLYPGVSRAGWGFMVLSNFLPNGGNGRFTLHAVARSSSGEATVIASKTIVATNATSLLPFGTIDTPGQGATVSGTVLNFGWALTPQPKSIPFDGSTIDVYIDGEMVGHPTYNQFRPDIATLFPGYANSSGAVGYFQFDSTMLSNGLHTISWVVRDNAGATQGVGSRFFRVQN